MPATNVRIPPLHAAAQALLAAHDHPDETVRRLAQEDYGHVVRQAKSALNRWRAAHRQIKNSAHADVRSQARINRSTAQQVLEELIGEEETQAILYQGQSRSWMHRH